MSLIHFHRFLIACGILFCFGFAAWEFVDYLHAHNTSALVYSGLSVWAGFGLIFYLRRLRQFLKLPVN
jgi:hypothetical protein